MPCADWPVALKLRSGVQVKKDFQEVVLGARQDDFFRKHMYANFGDLGMAVKGLVDEFQKAHNTTSKVSTIEDMQNFVENFSEFSAAQRNAGKHVTLMSELSRLVDSRNLMTVSHQAASQEPHMMHGPSRGGSRRGISRKFAIDNILILCILT